MKVRFFGSPDCRDCAKVFVLLNKFQVDYKYIDTTEDDEELQNFCDEHKVDELPHLQFIIDKDVILQHIGPLREEEFIGYLVDYFPDY